MYQCTSLRDKCIQITIRTGDNEDPRIHPIYRIIDKDNHVNSILFSAIDYSST